MTCGLSFNPRNEAKNLHLNKLSFVLISLFSHLSYVLHYGPTEGSKNEEEVINWLQNIHTVQHTQNSTYQKNACALYAYCTLYPIQVISWLHTIQYNIHRIQHIKKCLYAHYTGDQLPARPARRHLAGAKPGRTPLHGGSGIVDYIKWCCKNLRDT